MVLDSLPRTAAAENYKVPTATEELRQAKCLSKNWRWFSWEGRRGGMDMCVLNYRSCRREGHS